MENGMTAASETSNPPEQHSLLDKLKRALLTPIRAMRLRYLPLLMIYYAYGALGLVAIAEAFWIKEALTLSPVELAAIGVWLTLPWTIKMVFGQLADSVPILGSQRRAYVFIGACLVASGLVILAGAAGGWITFASKNALYVTAQLLIVVGVVLQDVIADAMTTEVVERTLPDGTPKPEAEIQRELGLVQVLGRLALWSGILSVAGLSGWLAQIYSYETVFLLGLAVPATSLTGAMLVRLDATASKPIDWRILGGGLLFGAAVLAIGLGGVPLGQEIVFLISLAVIASMLYRVAEDVDEVHRRRIFYAALVIFLFRATPGRRRGLSLVHHRRSRLRRGVLRHARADRRRPQPRRRLALLRRHHAGADRQGSALGHHHRHHPLASEHCARASSRSWTEETLGFGARTIALVDTTVASPFAELSMIPALTLVAINAPAGQAGDMVCADGVVDERRAGGGTARDQISQPAVRGRPRLLCQSRRAHHRRGDTRLRRSGRRHPRLRQARHLKLSGTLA